MDSCSIYTIDLELTQAVIEYRVGKYHIVNVLEVQHHHSSFHIPPICLLDVDFSLCISLRSFMTSPLKTVAPLLKILWKHLFPLETVSALEGNRHSGT